MKMIEIVHNKRIKFSIAFRFSKQKALLQVEEKMKFMNRFIYGWFCPRFDTLCKKYAANHIRFYDPFYDYQRENIVSLALNGCCREEIAEIERVLMVAQSPS